MEQRRPRVSNVSAHTLTELYWEAVSPSARAQWRASSPPRRMVMFFPLQYLHLRVVLVSRSFPPTASQGPEIPPYWVRAHSGAVPSIVPIMHPEGSKEETCAMTREHHKDTVDNDLDAQWEYVSI